MTECETRKIDPVTRKKHARHFKGGKRNAVDIQSREKFVPSRQSSVGEGQILELRGLALNSSSNWTYARLHKGHTDS